MQQHTHNTPALDRVLKLPEAARIASVHPSTLKRIAERGELRIIKLSPRRLGIRHSELTRWLTVREGM